MGSPSFGLVSHFKAAILDAWRCKVSVDLCGRQGFRGGPLLDIHGSLQLLNSSHVMERDKALLRSNMVGGVWNGFLLRRVRGHDVPCRFCGAPDGDVASPCAASAAESAVCQVEVALCGYSSSLCAEMGSS